MKPKKSISLAIVFSCIAVLQTAAPPARAQSLDGTYSVRERWSVTVTDPYSQPPRTFTKTGTASGTIHVVNGSFNLINTTGISDVGDTAAYISRNAYGSISADAQRVAYAFAGGAQFYVILKLSFAVIKVPLGSDGGFSLFTRDDYYSSYGSSLSDLQGSGRAVDGNGLTFDVTSASSLTPGGGYQAPKISSQPQSQFVLPGSEVIFEVTATSASALTYRWQRNGVALYDTANITGTDTRSLTINSAGFADAGDYTVVVSDNQTSVTSAKATLSLGASIEAQASAGGTVSPDYTGKVLPTGKSYLLSAKAATGHIFTGWTGSIVTNTPKLSFVLSSNMVLQANFITNGFIALKGSYNGLFSDPNGIEQNSSGLFSATVKPTKSGGSFSAKIQIGSANSSLSGAFDLSGHAVQTMTTKNGSLLTVELQLDLDPGAARLSGSISNNLWVANLSADRAIFSTANPCPFAGKYTIVLPGNDWRPSDWQIDPNAPQGDSAGALTVDLSGKIKFTASLADNTAATQSSALSKSGAWPLYIPLYQGKGSLQSWIAFANPPEYDLTGRMAWIKPANAAAKYFPLGFTNEIGALGAIYHPPAAGQSAIALTADSLLLLGENSPAPFTNAITLTAANKIVNNDPANKLTLTINVTSGSLSGSLTPAGASAPTPLKGVILQKQNIARGYFLDSNKGGNGLLIQ